MMTSMLNLELRTLPQGEPLEAAEQESKQASADDSTIRPVSENSEYEIVLGRTQIASWLFVAVMGVAVCSSLAYLAGKAIAARRTAVNFSPAVAPAPIPTPVVAPAALPQASIMVAPKVDLASLVKNQRTSAPLFAEPEVGKVYVQIGAVERGMAMLLAEGLRTHGFESFVASGPNEKIFRVLIGPLPDPAAFQQAMVTVNSLELSSFARKYQK